MFVTKFLAVEFEALYTTVYDNKDWTENINLELSCIFIKYHSNLSTTFATDKKL